MHIPATNAMPLDAAGPSRDRLRTAARELETQFAQMMLKTMRNTSLGDPMLGDNTMYREMYDQQLAKEMAKGDGLGLAPMIVRQLERSQGSAELGTDSAMGFGANAGLPLMRNLPMAMPLSASPATTMALPGVAGGGLTLAPSSSGVSMNAAAPLLAPIDVPAPAETFAGDPDAKIDASSPEAFVRSIWPHAQRTAAELGVPAKALVAQAALETGWGRRLVGGDGSHNLFGIKATGWKGATVNSATHEFVGGVRRNQRDNFRAYDSIHQSFDDYAKLMRNDRYAGALAAGDNPAGFARALQRAGYATDPSYAAKITAIANGPTLDRALAGLSDTAPATRAYASVAPTVPRG